jgi:integrase
MVSSIWGPVDSSATRDAYALDLRQFVTFCTVTGFYRYAGEKGLIAHSPAVHVRRPRIDHESHAIGLDRNEVGALLVAAGLGPAAEHAFISLLALNGLRVSEAIGADIEARGVERGHRTLTVVPQGGKTVTIPLAPRTARAVDLAIGERTSGPIFITTGGQRLDCHSASRIVRRAARRAGVAKPSGPHTLRYAFITSFDAGAATKRARGRLARRPPHDHALRPGQSFPRRPRHLHRLYLHRRSSPLTWRSGRQQTLRWRPRPGGRTTDADSEC